MQHRVVIVGGGFGGLYCARALKSTPVEVTLIDRRNFHLFQPLLYQIATGGLSPANISAPLRGLLSHQANAEVRLGEVVDFDSANRHVVLGDGTRIGYDTLIVAAGSVPHYFGHDEWQIAAPALKSIADAREIRRRVLLAFEAAELTSDADARRSCLTFIVVGGGATGVELAGSLAELAHHTLKRDFRHFDPSTTRIILIEGGERILASFPPELSSKAATALVKLGVEIHTVTTVTQIEPGAVTIKTGDRSDVIRARTVTWAAGVKASPLGALLSKSTQAMLDKSGRVVVQADLTIPAHPEILVIGDLASLNGADGKPLPGVAQVAMQQGRYASELIRNRLSNKSTDSFRYNDRGSLAVIGRKPGDPLIEDSLRVIDAVLKLNMPAGPCWRRYNHDGYGQQEDGGPYQGWGYGHAWPVLTGERGHYELAAGRDAQLFIKAMEGFATFTPLLPEQVWALPDRPDT